MARDYSLEYNLQYELEFRDLMLDIAKDFIRLPREKTFEYMWHCLKLIGNYFQVDRAFFCGIDKGYPQTCRLVEWCNNGIPPGWSRTGIIPPLLIKWWVTNNRDNIVIVDDVDKIPAKQKVKSILQTQGIKSILTLVLHEGTKIIGFIGLVTVKNLKRWPRHYSYLLNIARKIFLSAFAKSESEKIMYNERDLLSVTINSIQDGVISVNNEDLSIEIFNKGAEKITGYKKEEVLGKKLAEVLNLYNAEQIAIPMEEYLNPEKSENCNNEYRLLASNGSFKFISFTLSPAVFALEKPRTVIVIKDITESKKAEEEIKYLSYFDKLTGLYNRTYFKKQLAEIDKERNLPLSIIMADCNGLKIVNDAFGHDEGDRLLVHTARVLQRACCQEDIVARIGGDEFAIILPKVDQEAAYVVFQRIKEYCAEEKSLVVVPSLAMGIATKTSPDEDINRILKKAEDRMYSAKLSENKSTRSSVVLSLRKTLEERTHETEEHASRLRVLSTELGKRMGLNDSFLTELSLLAHLHDIGKIATPDSILNKPGKLTEEEWAIMKKHSEAGYRIAASSPELAFIADYILSHHERWDGTGYPEQLKHYQIPLQSRIIAVVDAYDAMTNPRVYKKLMTKEEALAELERCAGTQFDPAIVKTFVEMMREMQ